MNIAKKTTGVALAAAAATLFSTGTLTGCAGEPEVSGSTVGHCVGVNACKGMSSCATADNKCKGMNACKGKGFVSLDKATCDQVAGKFEAH
jgi:hypothetical protein